MSSLFPTERGHLWWWRRSRDWGISQFPTSCSPRSFTGFMASALHSPSEQGQRLRGGKEMICPRNDGLPSALSSGGVGNVCHQDLPAWPVCLCDGASCQLQDMGARGEAGGSSPCFSIPSYSPCVCHPGALLSAHPRTHTHPACVAAWLASPG